MNFAGVVVSKVSSDNIYEKIKGELEKRRLPILGNILFSDGIVEVCLQGQPMEMAYTVGWGKGDNRKASNHVGIGEEAKQ